MLARVRAAVGRAATVTGAVVLTGGLGSDVVTLPGAAAAAVTAGVGLAANPKVWRAPTEARWTAISLYAAPHAGCAVLLVGERLAPNTGGYPCSSRPQWQRCGPEPPGGCVPDYSPASSSMRPWHRRSPKPRRSRKRPPNRLPPTYASEQARWWGERFAIEGGVAPGTVLLEHRQVGEQCLALIIGAQKRGQPVPDISKPGLSAELDLPEELIDIGPVPGRGAGVRLLVLGQRPAAEAGPGDSDAEVWAEIAATAMPGVELIEATTYEMPKELT
ncbi:hypothetical protein GCM10020254_87590 [Streptomyces goshikiensis]